jgi:hypothetical protein
MFCTPGLSTHSHRYDATGRCVPALYAAMPMSVKYCAPVSGSEGHRPNMIKLSLIMRLARLLLEAVTVSFHQVASVPVPKGEIEDIICVNAAQENGSQA